MRLASLLLLTLVACPAAKDTAATDSAAAELGPNPVVPAEYELLWDLDAESCEDTGAIVYFRFEGEIDEAGRLTGTETWYWFHSGEGWEGDCFDEFAVDLDEGGLDWGTEVCVGCDREFLGDWSLRDDESEYGCTSYGYEFLFDDDDTDRIDEEEYSVDILLDPLSPSGNVNQTMLVFGFTMDDEDENMWIGRPDARGDYVPVGDDYTTGPASVSWTGESGLCVSFGS